MKKLLVSTAAAIVCGLLGSLSFTGCATAPKVTTSQVVDQATGATNTVTTTNMVTTLDPQAIQGIRNVIEPGVARLLAKVIQRSPQHAAEIRQYGGAIASLFCQMNQNNNFSVAYLVDAANAATADLQTKITDDPDTMADITAAKQTLIALFDLESKQYLTWNVPQNVWLQNLTGAICDVISKSVQT